MIFQIFLLFVTCLVSFVMPAAHPGPAAQPNAEANPNPNPKANAQPQAQPQAQAQPQYNNLGYSGYGQYSYPYSSLYALGYGSNLWNGLGYYNNYNSYYPYATNTNTNSYNGYGGWNGLNWGGKK